MNFLELIADASFIVQLVLLVLIFFSVFSWTIVFFKRKTLRSAESQSRKFLSVFRKSSNLSDVNDAARKLQASPLASLFQSGFKELAHLAKANPKSELSPERMESLNRALLKASNSEVARLEKMMFFLATTGNVTPFIGLFGTVWGIMDAFIRIGVVRSASLATVAPGIAEALVTTAVGLFCAIPAVIAYNYFLQRIKGLITEMEDFSLEFLNIAGRLYGS